MKFTVFGATGGIGREVVRQALAAGHQVTAVVRDPARLGVTDAGLEVVRADLTDPQPLRTAVAGRDAVLSGLGRARPQGRRHRRPAHPHRAVGHGGGGGAPAARGERGARSARPPRATAPWTAPCAPCLGGPEGRVRRPAGDGGRAGAQRHGLDVVRPPSLQNKPLTGSYRTVVGGNPAQAAGSSAAPTWPTRCWR